MRVYLTGFMGAGKSAVGGILAEDLGCSFLDLDQAIEERAGRSIQEIFARQGENAFRDLEHESLKETGRYDDIVVATGGGVVTFERNREVLRALGTTVWLHPDFATIVSRLDDSARKSRPLFRKETEANKLYRERLPAYRTADLEIEIAPEEGVATVARRIVRELRARL
jgi:shikimate kinase